MDFDDLLWRYFGTAHMSQMTASSLASGTERVLVDFGLEQDRAKRFALWSLLYLLSQAPDLDIAFVDQVERDAARNFMDMLAAAEPDLEP